MMDMEIFPDEYSQKLNRFPIDDMVWVRDILSFDAPLLSEYTTESPHDGSQSIYLVHWCDCDEEFDRWMVVRTSQNDLVRLLVQKTELRSIIEKAMGGDIFFLDTSRHDDGDKYWTVSSKHVPQSYLPLPDDITEADNFSGITDADHISVLFEGSWDFRQISDFLHTYRQLYNFVASVRKEYIRNAESVSWQGGFSAVVFFNSLANLTPLRLRASEKSVVANSPGLLQVSVDRSTANQVIIELGHYDTNKKKIVRARNALKNAIKKKKLYSQESPEKAVEIFRADPVLLKCREIFVSALGLSGQRDIISQGRNDFEFAKILIAYEKRLSDVYSAVESQQKFVLAHWEVTKFLRQTDEEPDEERDGDLAQAGG